jgi:hypothetical protein
MKFGFAYRRSPVESLTSYGGGANTRIRSTALQNTCTVGGVTGLCNEADIRRDSDTSYILNSRSLYWNDSYKKSRATVNLGLRYDRQFDIARAATIPANSILPDLLPSLKYPGADSGARYNNLSPRGGITYDLRGNGKSVLKANAGRYYGLGMATASTLQPTQATTLRYAWRDLNGDQSVQRNELDLVKGFLTTPTSNYDPANPSAAITPATVDPNLRNDKTDEVVVGFDHELMANFGVGVSYFYRKYSDLQGTYRTQDFTEAYTLQSFTAVCGNAATCGTQSFTGPYYQRATALHAPTILRNDTKYNTYNGVEFVARKRLANKWMMNGSLVWNHQRHFEPDANIDYLDPTNHAPVDLISGYESGGISIGTIAANSGGPTSTTASSGRNAPVVGKLSGMYQFPWGINFAANFNGHSSFPYNPYILTGNRTGGQGGVAIFLNPSNTLRYPALFQTDVHVDKTLAFGGSRRISLNFDWFNLMNNNVVLAQVERLNQSTAGNITTMLAPRVARFGLKVNF